jgi:hypothetical protein
MPRNRRQRQRKEARRLAGAAVPTIASINRQYGRAMDDVGGFTDALVAMLRDSGPNPYHAAIAGARDIQEAGMQRLADLGVDPGATATLGAGQDQSLEGLLARGAAEGAYTRRQPGIAASRGALAQQGLVQGRTDALHERADAFRSAFTQAIEQVKANAFAHQQFKAQRKDANRNYALQQQQAATQASQFQQSQAEQIREFDADQKRLREQYIQDQKAALQKSPYTASQISSFRATTVEQAHNAILAGVAPQKFINDAISRGIPREVAAQSAAFVYGQMADRVIATGNVPQFLDQNPKQGFAFRAYQAWIKQLQNMYGKKKKKPGQGFNPAR